VTVNATAFATVDLSLFSAIFVPSDHGGTLTGNDLRALDNRGSRHHHVSEQRRRTGRLAEDGDHQPCNTGPEPQLFGFLPFLVSSTGLKPGETGFTLSAFGTSLGLTVADINNNFSHNFFYGHRRNDSGRFRCFRTHYFVGLQRLDIEYRGCSRARNLREAARRSWPAWFRGAAQSAENRLTGFS
jgi:hypothetical protein